jgi:DNA-binding transcriptional MerR regulator
MSGMTIGKLAAAEGVGVETVRFYQRRGLLAKPERRGSGYREYTEADRWRLVFIRRARELGFILGEIAELLGPAEAQSAQEIAVAAQAKPAAVDYAGVIDLVKVNVDENPETARKYGILHVPTVSVFSGGEIVKQVIGGRGRALVARGAGGRRCGAGIPSTYPVRCLD